MPISFNFTSGTITETVPETPDYYCDTFLENYQDLYGKDVSEVPGALKLKVVGILRPKSTTNFGTLNRGFYFTTKFANKYMADAEASNLMNDYKDHIINKRFKDRLDGTTVVEGTTFNVYTKFIYDDYKNDPGDDPTFKPTVESDYASALNGDLTSSLSSLFFSFMGGSSNLDVEKEHIRAVAGLKINEIPDEFDPLDTEKFEYSYYPTRLIKDITIISEVK